jgi:hypothetical protein
MARMKQVARSSTGGKPPTLAGLMRKYADKGILEENMGGWKSKAVTKIWASAKDEFGACDDVATNGHYVVPSEALHPLVRGFVKLLGKGVVTPLADLAILLGGDCSPEGGPDLDEVRGLELPSEESEEVIFERLRVSYDADLGTAEHQCWKVMASKRGKAVWNEVSVLTYDAFVGSSRIRFEDFADEDPDSWALWAEFARADAAMIWRAYKDCKGRVMAQRRAGSRRCMSTSTFKYGSRGPSETAAIGEYDFVRLQYTRLSDNNLSCVVASLANLVVQCNPEFASRLVSGSRGEEFPSLRSFANWLSTASSLPSKSVPFELVNCLPADLRSQSLRDPLNRGANIMEQKERLRLDWLMEQSAGDFLVTMISSGGDSSHVIGVSAHRRYVFDHEERFSLPFSRSGMDAACSGRNACAGLGEVKMVVLKDVKKRKRAN